LTQDPYDLILRPITGPEELDLFTRLQDALNHELADDLAGGRRRPEWMWVALRGDHLVARAAWWARPGHDEPYVLDVFDLDEKAYDRVDVGVRLLKTAMAEVPARPEYCRFVPPGWRGDPAVRGPVEERMSGTPVPSPRGRLKFRPVGAAEELIRLMADVLGGTLDAHGRADLTRMTAWEAAVAQYEDELSGYTSPREWWRIATLPDGEPVGFVIPARNAYHPIIAYIAVRPAHRGHGYVDDILAEGTRVLAAQDVPLIRASTDLGNVPMARAFERAGYVAFEHQIDMTWS
jgi:ribosomal protein S18 acetylase RimI-like enzyme